MRLLVATLPYAGHVLPTSAFVRAAITAGHTVVWYSGPSARAPIEAAGATFVPMVQSQVGAIDWTPMGLAAWVDLYRRDAIHQQADLLDVLTQEPADVIVSDPCILGAREIPDVPTVGLGILPLLDPDPKLPLILQCTVREAEMPCRYPNVAFIGPLLPPEDPAWSTQFVHAPQKPLVVVTQGTMATDPADLLWPAVEALRDLPVEVIVHLSPQEASRLHSAVTRAAGTGAMDLPTNVFPMTWMAWSKVLPLASCLVTNGGNGGVQAALYHGCPMVVAGDTEEKLEVGKRVAWAAGTGISLGTRQPSPALLREAILAVLTVPRYTAQALMIAERCQRTDAPTVAVRMIEQLVADRAEVSAGRRTADSRRAGRPSGSRRAQAPEAASGTAATPHAAPMCTGAAVDTPSAPAGAGAST